MSVRYKTFRLDNGLQVILKPVPAAPVVSTFIWYRAGARQEPPGKSGLAHFLEHMLFKGTRLFPKGEITRRIGRTGGQQNAFTSYDYTAYFETVPAEYLDLALAIEADRMRGALLNPREMEKERTVIISELEGYRNHPHVRLRDLVNAHTWLRHPYRRPVIGWRDEVEALQVRDLREFYEAWYQPWNAVLVVAGRFSEAALRRSVAQYFGRIRPGAVLTERPLLEAPPAGERRLCLHDYGPTGLLEVRLPVPPARDDDHFSLAVLNNCLAKGKTSRLYRALVDGGLASEISGALYEMIDPGVWVFSAICQAGVAASRVEDVLRQELEKLRAAPLTPMELERALVQTRADLIYSKDSLTDQAMMLGFYQTVAGDWRRGERFPEKIAEVTACQAQASAQKYLAAERMIVGHFIPREQSHGADHLALPAQPAPGCYFASRQPGTSLGGARRARRDQCRRFILSNGVVLLAQPHAGNPSVALSGLVRGGMICEPSDREGLAVLHAHMLDRGSSARSALALAETLENKGLELAFSAGQEEIGIQGRALTADLPLLLASVAECLAMPVFPEVELEKARSEILAQARADQAGARQQAWQGFLELAYPPGHPARRSLIRAEAALQKASQSDLQAFHQQWARPEAAIISLAGDLDPEAVAAAAEKAFASWRAETLPAQVKLASMETVTRIHSRREVMPGKQECLVVMGHQGLYRQAPDYYAALVANHLLGGGGLSGLFMRRVRDEQGLTYSIFSNFRRARGMRPWVLVLQADPAKAIQAVDASREVIRKLQAGRWEAKLLDDGREQIAGEMALSLETAGGLAYFNREIELHQLGWDYSRTFPNAVRAVDREAVIAASRKYLHPDHFLLSLAGPALPEAAWRQWLAANRAE